MLKNVFGLSYRYKAIIKDVETGMFLYIFKIHNLNIMN